MNDKEQEVCPIGEIGYYYPAEVFVGGMACCTVCIVTRTRSKVRLEASDRDGGNGLLLSFP